MAKYTDQLFERLGVEGERWPLQAQVQPNDDERQYIVQDGKSVEHGSVGKKDYPRFKGIGEFAEDAKGKLQGAGVTVKKIAEEVVEEAKAVKAKAKKTK